MLREDLKNITINDLLVGNEISIRTGNCCFNAKFNSLFDIIEYYEKGNSFFNIRKAGRQTCLELQDLCSKYISQIGELIEVTEILSEEEKLQKRQNEIKELIETDFIYAIENKLIDLKDFISYLTINQKAILEEKYNKHLTNYSIRTVNRLQSIGFEAFVTLYLFQNDKELLKVKNLGKKSLEEAVDLKNKMKKEFSHIINLPEEDLTQLELVHQKGEIMLNDFVFDFYKQNNHLPMFWILEQYIINDSSRKIDILTSTFNIIQNWPVLSLEKIAEKYNITRERVRQIRCDTFRKTFEITDEIIEYGKNSDLIKYNQLLQNKNDWAYILEFLNEKKLNQESFEIQECLKKEQCNFSFEFALQIIAYLFRDIFSLFGGIEISNKDRIWENTFLIRKEFTCIFDFENFIGEFKNHIAGNETEYDLNIEDYLTNSACWTSVIDLNKFDDIVCIAKDILLYEFCLYSNIDGLITIPATKERNLFDVIYEILQKNGNPMHLDEIFIEFKKILSEHKYTEASQLRSWLQRHEAISFRNRKSVYTLKEWKHIKSGTIRDTIVEFLSKNDSPQTAECITEYVLQYFPKTNTASVRTTMLNDTQKRFSFYGDNLFGLVSKEYPVEYELITLQEGQRKAFEQRLYDLEKFLSEYDHFPFSSSDNEEETSLYRWWRLQNQDPKLSDRQKADINRIKNQYADYETDKTIYEWFCHLNDLKLFLLENRRLPSARGSEKFLYGWLRRAKDDFNNQRLNEKQRRKYAELFKEIYYAER